MNNFFDIEKWLNKMEKKINDKAAASQSPTKELR